MRSRTNRILILLFSVLAVAVPDASARAKRGHDVAIATFRVDVDLDVGSVVIKRGASILGG